MPLPPRFRKPELESWAIGNAGVFYAATELSLRGLIALPTARNTAGIDLLVSDPHGAPYSLQVKTSQNRVTGWPTPKPEHIPTEAHHFFLFLRRTGETGAFEGFLVSAREVRIQVARNIKAKRERGSKDFHGWRLPVLGAKRDRLRLAWLTWGLKSR
jgi:hypothetical protein